MDRMNVTVSGCLLANDLSMTCCMQMP